MSAARPGRRWVAVLPFRLADRTPVKPGATVDHAKLGDDAEWLEAAGAIRAADTARHVPSTDTGSDTSEDGAE